MTLAVTGDAGKTLVLQVGGIVGDIFAPVLAHCPVSLHVSVALLQA